MKRGNLYWVDLPEKLPEGAEMIKKRPCIILSNTEVCAYRKTIVVVPLTSAQKSYYPLSVPVPSAGENSMAICDQLHCVDKKRVIDFISEIPAKELQSVAAAIKTVLDLL